MTLLYFPLLRLSSWFAALGALVALGAGLLTTASVVSRAIWNQPIAGDVEITQMVIALAISLCLPHCQARKANILVDFFTQKLSSGRLRILDAMGCFFLALIYAFLAWRTSAGAVSVREAGETTMIISLPMWWAYACLAPGLALASLIALLQSFGASAPQATPT
jgi:TRAP-type C4-dicarboxylate transport system permease small subunit